MQDFINAISQILQDQRSKEQMTLGELIATLESYPQEKQITNINFPHSYRCYYEDLALEQGEGTRSVGSLVELLKTKCLDNIFYGYKGGSFTMKQQTPIWIAEYGSCGMKLMDIMDGEVLDLITESDED